MSARVKWSMAGAALVLLLGGGALRWKAGAALPAPQWQQDGRFQWARFGSVVGAAGDVNGDGLRDLLVLTAEEERPPDGSLLVYHGSEKGLPEQPAAQIRFGSGGSLSAAWAGDVNGDGYADLITGSPESDHGIANDGQVQLYLGSRAGLASTPVWQLASGELNGYFGSAVSTAGDVDGDGFADILVGAPGIGRWQGQVYLFRGSPDGPAKEPAWTYDGTGEAKLGTAVAGAGDVNRDGYADVLVGAPGFDQGRGRAYLFYGSAQGLAKAPDKVFEGLQPGGQFGAVVGAAGDVNGDGFADLVISAPRQEPEAPAPGAVYLYLGGTAGPAASPDWSATAQPGSVGYFGVAASAGDLNGDGFADLVIGQSIPRGLWTTRLQRTGGGAVVVYYGGPQGLGAEPVWVAGTSRNSGLYGFAVAAAGDMNGDGYSDLVVGAPAFDAGQGPVGRVFLYHGSKAGLPVHR